MKRNPASPLSTIRDYEANEGAFKIGEGTCIEIVANGILITQDVSASTEPPTESTSRILLSDADAINLLSKLRLLYHSHISED